MDHPAPFEDLMEYDENKLYDSPIQMPASHPFKILIATDSPQIANILRSKLERDGFAVFWKQDGKSTLEFVRSDPPALLILDSILPEPSAFHLLGQIRSVLRFENLPVFVLLDVLQEYSAEDFLRCGAREVIPKPFRPTDLSKKIRKTLSPFKGTPRDLVNISGS